MSVFFPNVPLYSPDQFYPNMPCCPFVHSSTRLTAGPTPTHKNGGVKLWQFTTSKCCDCHILHNSGKNLTQLERSENTKALIQVTAFQGDFTTT